MYQCKAFISVDDEIEVIYIEASAVQTDDEFFTFLDDNTNIVSQLDRAYCVGFQFV